MDRSRFYAVLRARNSGVFGTSLSQSQTEGIERILDEGQRRGTNLRHLAYILATAYHETGGKMQPLQENLNYSMNRLVQVWPKRFPTLASAKPYANNPEALANKVYGGRMGNVKPGDGWQYRGRGLVQITGRANYAKFAIESSPDDAMEPGTSIRILFDGMLQGKFTGKKLLDFIYGEKPDYYNARQVVNALDRADDIRKYALTFADALRDAGYIGQAPAKPLTPPQKPVESVQPSEPVVVAPKPEVVSAPVPEPPVGDPWWLRLLKAIGRGIAKLWRA